MQFPPHNTKTRQLKLTDKIEKYLKKKRKTVFKKKSPVFQIRIREKAGAVVANAEKSEAVAATEIGGQRKRKKKKKENNQTACVYVL